MEPVSVLKTDFLSDRFQFYPNIKLLFLIIFISILQLSNVKLDNMKIPNGPSTVSNKMIHFRSFHPFFVSHDTYTIHVDIALCLQAHGTN